MHLAVSKDGKNFVALNHNSGVLFAKASENDDGSLNPKTLGFPIIVSKNDLQELGIVSFDDGKSVSYNEIDKSYAVAAILLGPDGQDFQEKNNEKDAVLFFTDDFVHYSESHKIRFEDYEKIKKNAFLQMEKLEPENFKYNVEQLQNVVSKIEGALPCNVIQILWMKDLLLLFVGINFL